MEDERQPRRARRARRRSPRRRARRAGSTSRICPPFTLIAPAVARSGGLAIGGQDCHWAAERRPYRRRLGGDAEGSRARGWSSSATANAAPSRARAIRVVRGKAEAALAQGLQAIVCVGESDAERRAGDQLAVVAGQLEGSLPDEWKDGELVVAYEPIWAIGTGKVATAADVAEMHAAIRAHLVGRYGERGGRLRILYGGSVKADNAAELFACRRRRRRPGRRRQPRPPTTFVPIIEAAAAS